MKRLTFYAHEYAFIDSEVRVFSFFTFITKTKTIEIGVKLWRWETGFIIWLDGEQ